MHARKSLDCWEGNIGRNINIKGDSGMVSGRKELQRKPLSLKRICISS